MIPRTRAEDIGDFQAKQEKEDRLTEDESLIEMSLGLRDSGEKMRSEMDNQVDWEVNDYIKNHECD